jgi:hypothetical protein
MRLGSLGPLAQTSAYRPQRSEDSCWVRHWHGALKPIYCNSLRRTISDVPETAFGNTGNVWLKSLWSLKVDSRSTSPFDAHRDSTTLREAERA